MTKTTFAECAGRIADAVRMTMDLAAGSAQAEACVRDLAKTTAQQFAECAGWTFEQTNTWFARAGFPRN